jgi:fused signal recognition particle receptor
VEPAVLLLALVIAIIVGLTVFPPGGRRASSEPPPGREGRGGTALLEPPKAPPAPPAAGPKPPAPPTAGPSAPPSPPAPAAPPPGPAPVAAAPEAPAAPKLTLRERMKRGLVRSRGRIAESLAGLARRDKLDLDAWDEVEETLIGADLGMKATMQVVQNLKDKKPTPATLRAALSAELVEVLGHPDRTLHTREGQPSIWLVTGVNGVGKTTTIAKLANRLKGEGKTVVLAAADTFRAAAIDQLGTWADRVGVHMVKHGPGSDPGAVAFDAVQYAKARNIDVVIIDTAGRLHTKSNLMEELKKVRRIMEREAGEISETLLVLDATVGQNGIAQAKTFKEAVDVTGLVLTKLDGSARGGIVVAVEQELGVPVKAVGLGEGMDDLMPFDPQAFVDGLLGDDLGDA